MAGVGENGSAASSPTLSLKGCVDWVLRLEEGGALREKRARKDSLNEGEG